MSSLLFFLAILSFAAADFCPKDTVTDRARLKCYKFINTQRNFTEAKNLCKEFGGNIANLPNDTGLLQKVKEITRQDPCYFWVANARSNCVLALNGKYPQEVSNCSIVASFLCEFEPTCSSTSYFGNPTTRYVSTTATTRTVPVANHPCQNTVQTVDPLWKPLKTTTTTPYFSWNKGRTTDPWRSSKQTWN
ncbi:hypothetical protein QR680_018618 [Steinernema hermaphroditum]|uniref:C-type lectin domain-containing protein n=1 Tax=Steinernema hermaphroditum TaxID=289476 RepID=A0AA39HKS3_9BILA|nr:hypothetical protein QR680_018618 [Steinernema hermaphroditum]